jgi:hypothetical protein
VVQLQKTLDKLQNIQEKVANLEAELKERGNQLDAAQREVESAKKGLEQQKKKAQTVEAEVRAARSPLPSPPHHPVPSPPLLTTPWYTWQVHELLRLASSLAEPIAEAANGEGSLVAVLKNAKKALSDYLSGGGEKEEPKKEGAPASKVKMPRKPDPAAIARKFMQAELTHWKGRRPAHCSPPLTRYGRGRNVSRHSGRHTTCVVGRDLRLAHSLPRHLYGLGRTGLGCWT